jgi:demethoxyubiquinone hydroxylase (CLK1/Coq7/Cat5 family)
MRTHGLEAALVDNDPIPFAGLGDDDHRQTLVKVAGVAALLVAKLHKINERLAESVRPDRLVDKDAGDILRLIRSTPVATMAGQLARLRDDELSARATAEALAALPALFASPTAPAVQMAVRAVALSAKLVALIARGSRG